jgi:hypothetical protein
VKNSIVSGRKLSHKFTRRFGRPATSTVYLEGTFNTVIPKLETTRPRTQARDIFCLSVFTEQLGASKFHSPTCSLAPADPENLFSDRLRWRNDEVRPETDLVPAHSCASTVAKSTQATHSGHSYDLLVSAHRGFQPAGSTSRKLLYVAVGKMRSWVDTASKGF